MYTLFNIHSGIEMDIPWMLYFQWEFFNFYCCELTFNCGLFLLTACCNNQSISSCLLARVLGYNKFLVKTFLVHNQIQNKIQN